MTPHELEERRLELKEKYSFKFNKKHNCFTFELDNKKAFFINLSEPDHHNLITPFFMRRSKLSEIVDEMFEAPANEGITKSNDFIGISIEIIGNMLDESKMGSVEGYINHIWEKAKAENKITDIIEVFSSVIAMIDFTIDEQLNDMPQDQLKKIHDDFFTKQMKGLNLFAVKPDGEVVKVLGNSDSDLIEDDSGKKYDLRNMTPLNTKEI